MLSSRSRHCILAAIWLACNRCAPEKPKSSTLRSVRRNRGTEGCLSDMALAPSQVPDGPVLHRKAHTASGFRSPSPMHAHRGGRAVHFGGEKHEYLFPVSFKQRGSWDPISKQADHHSPTSGPDFLLFSSVTSRLRGLEVIVFGAPAPKTEPQPKAGA